MNTDDPKFTAFALGELTPAERVEIERELRDDPGLTAEITETREMAGILKMQLAAEPAGALAEHQRWAIIRAAAATRTPGANERNVIIESAWWQRAGVWQAVAACAVFGFGIYAISEQLSKPSARRTAGDMDNGGIVVPVPPGIPAVADSGEPEVLTPAEAQSRLLAKNGANVDAAKAFPNGVFIVPPRVADQLAPGGVKDVTPRNIAKEAHIEVKREDGKIVIEVPTESRVATNDPRRPTPIGSNPNGAGASKVSYAAQTVEEVRALAKQAEAFGQGTTFAEFKKLFRPSPGMKNLYELHRFPLVRIDAEFVGADGTPLTGSLPDDALIKTVSKPYLGSRVAQ